MGATGSATLNFGSAPGTNVVEVAVPDPAVLGTSAAEAFLMTESSADHNAYEHAIIPLKLSCSVSNGVGITITASSTLRLTGTFKVRWVWV